MIKENRIYKTLVGIHVVFFTSLLCFGITYLSGTLLMIPALCATFHIGKMIFYRKLDINDSIIKNYWIKFKEGMKMLKFLPFQFIIILNILSIIINKELGIMSYFSMAIVAFLGVYLLYACEYYTFIDEQMGYTDVLIYMFYNPFYVVTLFILSLLGLLYMNIGILKWLLIIGSVIVFIIEFLMVVQVATYKKAFKLFKEDETLEEHLARYKPIIQKK